jgi:phage gp45-like
MYTETTATDIDPDNIVIHNSSSKVTITPSGEITIDAPVSTTINSSAVTVNADTATVVSPVVTVTATTTTINSQVVINGITQINGALSVLGGNSATFSGDLDVTGSIANNGTNIGETHTHSGVQVGLGNTGTPN